MVIYCECADEFLVSKSGEKWGLKIGVKNRAYGMYFHDGFRRMGLMDKKRQRREE